MNCSFETVRTINFFNLFSLALFISGILGISFHSSRLYTPQLHVGEAPPALDVLLASLAIFFSLEAYWWSSRSVSKSTSSTTSLLQLPQGRSARHCRLACTFFTAISSPLLFILYLIGYRADGAMWILCTTISIFLISRNIWLEELSEAAVNSTVSTESCENEGPQSPLVDSSELNTPSSSLSLSSSSSQEHKHRCLDCCLPQGTPRSVRALSCLHSSFWCLASTVLVLLLGGAGTIADGWHRYPPRGQIYSISLPEYSNSPAGNTQRIHAWCTGPSSSSSIATLFLDFGGGGHSMSDVYGLQEAFNAAGRRVCLYDPPGTGWSPLGPGFNADSSDSSPTHSKLISSLLSQMDEPGPFIFIGSMDGGAERIYVMALERPDLVRALIPMQYGVPEFTSTSIYYNYSQSQTEAFAVLSLAPRLSFCDVIRFLGVQWGLVSLFVPSDPNFIPKDREREKYFLNLFHEGQWDMQCRILSAQVNEPSLALQPSLWTSNRSLKTNIPVLAIDNPGPDPCSGTGSPSPGTDDCNIIRLSKTLNTAFMKSMTTMTANSSFVQCLQGPSVCLDWMGGGTTIPFVTANVIAFLNSIGA